MVDWPETPVPLFVPKEWHNKSKQTTDPQTCVFQYDDEHNLLKLISKNGNYDSDDDNDEPTVIDILDPEDVIGVTVEINMSTVSSSPRVSSSETRATISSKDLGDDRPANAPPTDTLADTQGHATLVIYAYPRSDPSHNSKQSSLLRWCGMGSTHPQPNPNYQRPTDDNWRSFGNRFAFHRRFVVVASEDVGALNALVKAIEQAAQLPDPSRRGRALVIVNPQSGPNHNAEEIYENVVNVLLEQSKFDHDLFVTQNEHHGKQRMMQGYKANQSKGDNDDHDDDSNSKDIADYSALICMGGDGIVHDCLQGIKTRKDWKEILQKVSIGIIGAGTSNGMAKSIADASHEQASVLDAAFLIAKGKSYPVDLSVYQTLNNSYFSFLTFAWAAIASIDIDSEVLRSLGALRFDIWGAWMVVKSKVYRAKFSYLPVKDYEKNNKATANKSPQALPPLNEPIPSKEWVTEEDDFLLFWASQVNYSAENTCSSPPSELNDGAFQILVIRSKNTSRLTYAKILLGFEKGGHVNIPQAEFIKCSAYRLEPLGEPSMNDLDGEVVESGPIQGQVLPAAMNVFSFHYDKK